MLPGLSRGRTAKDDADSHTYTSTAIRYIIDFGSFAKQAWVKGSADLPFRPSSRPHEFTHWKTYTSITRSSKTILRNKNH